MVNASDFQYQLGSGLYESRQTVHGRPITIAFSTGAEQDTEKLAAKATQTLAWLDQHYDEVLGFCADELLEDKNDGWVESDAEKVTESEFKSRLQLRRVEMQSDKTLLIIFKDGDLFWGHAVVVGTDADYHLEYATIEG